MNSKAAFCGVWRLDVSRSRFGFLPPPLFREDRLAVSDERLRVETRQEDDLGEVLVVRDLSAGGAPAEIDVRGRMRWCRGWWEDVEMVVEQEWEQGGNPRKVIDRWQLRRQGRELCLRREHVQKGGNVRQVLYFDRVDEPAGARGADSPVAPGTGSGERDGG